MKTGLSASALKTIAIITMFIDHLGYTLIYELDARGTFNFITGGKVDLAVYSAFRLIGRIAFVIFCFLLVEGFFHTSDRKKYALRLMCGAVISEIPFDLMCEKKLIDRTYQNVFFTLLIGFVTVWAVDTILSRDRSRILRILACAGVILAGLTLAEVIRSDYSSLGVGLILVFYFFRYNKAALLIAAFAEYFIGHIISDLISWIITGTGRYGLSYIRNLISADLAKTLLYLSRNVIGQMVGVLTALILIMTYNHSRGRQLPKYFYYAFYPVHMLALYCILRLYLHYF